MTIYLIPNSYSPYYKSAFAYYKLETFFRKGNIDTSYRKVKFHILMLFRILGNSKEPLPLFNSKKMDKYCDDLLKILNDDEKSNRKSITPKCVRIGE